MTTTNPMQAAFDQVYRHLLSQAEPSADDALGCSYHADNGLKCAVGCLIDEQFYKAELEGHGADDPRVLAAVRAGGWLEGVPDREAERLLLALQHIHDNDDPDEWARYLELCARAHGLRVDRPLDNADDQHQNP